MSEHTKEPWDLIFPNIIMGSDGIPVISTLKFQRDNPTIGKHSQEIKDANARRIMACVNACAGITDPPAALQEAKKALEEAESFIIIMFGNKNGELPEFVRTPIGVPVKLGEIGEVIRSALAKLGGG